MHIYVMKFGHFLLLILSHVCLIIRPVVSVLHFCGREEGGWGIVSPLREFSRPYSLGITDLDGSLQEKDKGKIPRPLIKIPKASSRVPSWVFI